MKVIINADDCGCTSEIDNHIENAIKKGKITSTTIMANMSDYDRALTMYRTYRDTISFGLHINLSEGEPLLYSQQLLDNGFYVEDNASHRVVFNGHAYKRKWLDSSCRNEIFKEIIAQANKLRDSGVVISHLDSHHHMHTANFMITVLPRVCKELGIYRVRNIRNYLPLSVGVVIRNGWTRLQKLQCRNIYLTDYFCSLTDFINNYKTLGLKPNDTIEIMCHPGLEGVYEEEERKLMDMNISSIIDGELVDYNRI